VTVSVDHPDIGSDGPTAQFLEPRFSDSDRVDDEYRGVTLDDAEDTYVGQRRSVVDSEYENTLHGHARRMYGRLLDADTLLRAQFDDPSVALLTLFWNPEKHYESTGDRLTLDQSGQELETGYTSALRRLRDRIDGDHWCYIGVREWTESGLTPHYHVGVLWDSARCTVGRETLWASVDSHVRATPGASAGDHGEGALRLDHDPAETVRDYDMSGYDREVPNHPLVLYTVASLPHLGEVGQLSPHEIRSGAAEAATPSQHLKTSRGVTNPLAVRRLAV